MSENSTVADQRNVILLSIDALRADHLSCYGYERETSPEIDAIATDGTQFVNAFSASSHTREAVPSLLTGRRPRVFAENGYRLVTNSLASVLSERGFSTAAFHSNPYVSQGYGYNQPFDAFDDDLVFGRNRFIALAQRALDKFVFNRGSYHARADEINERSLNWINELDTGEPFFLWNHYMDVHGPYNPPAGYSSFAEQSLSNNEAQRLYQKSINRPERITEEERQLLTDLYNGEIRYLDSRIGAFVDALADRDLLTESMVIITADHGDGFGLHGYYAHPRYVYNDLLAVPVLLLSDSTPARRVETTASTLDIAPTALQAVGADGDRFPGQSLFTLIQSNDEQPRRAVISSAQGQDEAANIRRFAIQDGRFKYLLERDAKTDAVSGRQAFDCENDSSEQNPFSEQALPQRLVELRSQLETHSAKVVGNINTIEDGDKDVSHEIERRLEHLGYK